MSSAVHQKRHLSFIISSRRFKMKPKRLLKNSNVIANKAASVGNMRARNNRPLHQAPATIKKRNQNKTSASSTFIINNNNNNNNDRSHRQQQPINDNKSNNRNRSRQTHPIETIDASDCICSGCDGKINDRYLLSACDKYWHESCLKCDRCQAKLGELGLSLYNKSNMNLCRQDYLEMFGQTAICSVCEKLIYASEMVMRAKQNVYHLECFACQLCGQRFCVGDRFYLFENKIVCQFDYEEHILPIHRALLDQPKQNGQPPAPLPLLPPHIDTQVACSNGSAADLGNGSDLIKIAEPLPSVEPEATSYFDLKTPARNADSAALIEGPNLVCLETVNSQQQHQANSIGPSHMADELGSRVRQQPAEQSLLLCPQEAVPVRNRRCTPIWHQQDGEQPLIDVKGDATTTTTNNNNNCSATSGPEDSNNLNAPTPTSIIDKRADVQDGPPDCEKLPQP